MWSDLLILPFGMVAGVLTTLAGMGGGLLLLAGLGSWFGAREALALSTPALFVSNLHRVYLLRKDVVRPTLTLFAVGAVPGALVGSLTAAVVPQALLSAILVVATLLAFARFLGILRINARPAIVAPAGFGIGALTGTAGGAGALVAPLYLSLGLTGTQYVATVSASAVVMHAVRIVGYGVGGMFGAGLFPELGLLLAGLLLGNGLGLRIRPHVSERATRWIEGSALGVATAFAVATTIE